MHARLRSPEGLGITGNTRALVMCNHMRAGVQGFDDQQEAFKTAGEEWIPQEEAEMVSTRAVPQAETTSMAEQHPREEVHREQHREGMPSASAWSQEGGSGTAQQQEVEPKPQPSDWPDVTPAGNIFTFAS